MPLDFVKRLLVREGALVETRENGALEAVLPDDARLALGLAEEAPVLALDGRAGSVACGYGTELLRAACARAIGTGAITVARAAVPPPRSGPVDGFAGLNVALRPGEPSPSEVWTLEARLRVDASADDRRVLAASAALALEASVVAIPVPEARALEPTGDRPPTGTLERAVPALARAARAAALEATAPFREAVSRRARRDVERIDRYFAELDLDLASRIARAGKGAPALEAKRALLPGERARRLAGLRENAIVRVKVEPVALRLVVTPAARVPLEVLRRKARRTLSVAWHPLLRAWLPLACEGCLAPVRAFGACDEAVHVLCAGCLEARACPRCARRGPDEALLRETRAAVEDSIELPAHPEGSPLDAANGAAVAAAPSVSAAAAPAPERAPDAPADSPRADGALTPRVVDLLRATAAALTSEEIQARLGAETLTAEALRRALARLVEEGRVERTGKARGTRYRRRAGL